MRGRGQRWRLIRQRLFLALTVSCAIALGVWIARPGLASDFGIIPHASPPAGQPPKTGGKPHQPKIIFPGPKFWREGPPHLSDLQATTVELWSDVKPVLPQIWTTSGPTAAKIQTVAVNVNYQIVYVIWPIIPHIWYEFVPPIDYCKKYDCHMHHCKYSEPGKGDDSCVVAAVPEPRVWAMMLFGFLMLGGFLRGRRSAASTPSA